MSALNAPKRAAYVAFYSDLCKTTAKNKYVCKLIT